MGVAARSASRIPLPTEPIEIEAPHICLLGTLTDALARVASRGAHGDDLGNLACSQLDALLREGEFERCCAPRYLSLAPERFEQELQLPIASDQPSGLDTRVLLWPVGSRDREHPHCDGWAAFATVRGDLTITEQRGGVESPERPIERCHAQLIGAAEDVSHHIHNRGSEVGMTIHLFGR